MISIIYVNEAKSVNKDSPILLSFQAFHEAWVPDPGCVQRVDGAIRYKYSQNLLSFPLDGDLSTL